MIISDKIWNLHGYEYEFTSIFLRWNEDPQRHLATILNIGQDVVVIWFNIHIKNKKKAISSI